METCIEGEFELVMNENFYEYLIALGVPSSQAQMVDCLKPFITIALTEKEVSITTKIISTTTTSVLKIDQEVEEKLAGLMVVKSFTTIGKDEFSIHSKGPEGETGKRHFDFFEDGMIMTLSSDADNVPVAKRFYKRIKTPDIEIGREEDL